MRLSILSLLRGNVAAISHGSMDTLILIEDPASNLIFAKGHSTPRVLSFFAKIFAKILLGRVCVFFLMLRDGL